MMSSQRNANLYGTSSVGLENSLKFPYCEARLPLLLLSSCHVPPQGKNKDASADYKFKHNPVVASLSQRTFELQKMNKEEAALRRKCYNTDAFYR